MNSWLLLKSSVYFKLILVIIWGDLWVSQYPIIITFDLFAATTTLTSLLSRACSLPIPTTLRVTKPNKPSSTFHCFFSIPTLYLLTSLPPRSLHHPGHRFPFINHSAEMQKLSSPLRPSPPFLTRTPLATVLYLRYVFVDIYLANSFPLPA